MMGSCGTFLQFISVLILLSSFCIFGVISEKSPLSELEIRNPKVLELLKDEVQQLNKDFTESFMLEASRKKRAYSLYTYDVKLDQSSNYLEVKVKSDDAYSFVCNGNAFILQSDGIYRLDGFSSASYLITANETTPTLKKVSSWSLNPGDKIMHAHEWKEKCFVLISNKNGTFSSIYTFYEDQMTPVFRQQIRNYGFATSAKFFTFKWKLYLIIANDNVVHSLTICPLFRWAGTYMDEIHSIQTRGAVAVETFTIHSREYIAIAQSEDAAGNYEVGTQVLRMDAKEQLEKVQLLWSNSPVTLKYIQVYQEHYLIIGLANEPSMCYWFGGIDFIYWQTLEGYKGQRLYMDALTLPDKEPVLLAAESKSVQFYTRSSSSTIMSLYSNATVLTVQPTAQIAHARFLRPSSSQVYLTLVQNYTGYLTLKIYPVLLIRKEIAESHIKESESQLSQCLIELRKMLQDEGGTVKRLDKEKDNILTVDDDLKFYGHIITPSSLTLEQGQTSIQMADVKPDTDSDLGHESSAANLQYLVEETGNEFKNNVADQLATVLMKSKAGEISGDYSFTNGFEAKKIISYGTDFQFEALNEVPWNTLDEYALRKETYAPQYITGNWTGESLTTGLIQIPSSIANIEINDFLLKQCPPYEEVEEVYGNFIFNKDVSFHQGLIIAPDGKVNNVLFSDVVLKNGPTTEIRGYKHALNLLGGEGFKFEYLNGRNFDEWFDSVIHTEGPIQYSEGLKTFVSSKGNTFENFHSKMINNESWEAFYSTALVNGTNQTIEGYLKVENLVVDSLVADSVGGVLFKDLMTISGPQLINSYLNISSLIVQNDLTTKLINGVPLSTLVVTKYEDAVINGPVELENFKINGSIDVAEYITIAGKDISELAKLRQKHIYYTESKNPINFRGPVITENLEAEYINQLYWDDLKNKYWSKSSDNVVPGPLDLRGRKVNVENMFDTGTLNYLNIENDVLRTDESDSIQSKLNFIGNVIAYDDVYQADGKTLSGTDISEIAKRIVNVNEERLIEGKKDFKGNIVASGGLMSSNVNGIDPVHDVVFLKSTEEQYIRNLKTFKNNVRMKILQTDAEIEVVGSVNGYDLKEIRKYTANRDEPITINGNIQFNNSFYASDLYVGKEINGINFTDLLQNAIFLDRPQVLNFPLVIQNGSFYVRQPSVVNSVNGVNLKEYFSKVVYLSPPGFRINGTKTFTNLTVDYNIKCNLFNGISLSNLSANAFSRTKPQSTNGKMYFESVDIKPNLSVEEIGGVRLEDLVYIDDPYSCIVNSNVRFTADKTIVNSPVRVEGLLNGYPAEKLSSGVQNALTDRQFKVIDVRGDLNWDKNQQDFYGISYVLKNAVTLEYSQVITGKVEFSEGFTATEARSEPWIDDVNLQEINDDGLHIGEYDVTFSGKNTFTQTVKVASLLGIDSLNAIRIDGVNLQNLNRNAVRDSYNGTIYGKKTFADGLDAENLSFKDLMGKGNFSGLVTTGDKRTIDNVDFYDVTVGDQLKIDRFENYNLEELLKTRVTIYGDQVLIGNYTIPGLDVNKYCKVFSINGIKRSDIFIDSPGQKQKLDGDKIFANGLTVEGYMDLPNVNGYNFAALHSDVYKRTEKQIIHRPVVFVQPVIVNEVIDVQNHINDYRIEELEARFSHALQEIEKRAYLPYQPEVHDLEKLQSLKYNMLDRPFWLEYLRLKQSWSKIPPKCRAEHTQTSDGVIIGLHDKTEVSQFALPKGCECNNVHFLKISGPSSTATVEEHLKCINAFIVSSPLGNVYTVLDRSLSYNQTCSTLETAETVISRGSIIGSTKENGDILLKELSPGFVTDVKTFSEQGVDYLIVAHYFNSKTRNHNAGTFVYSVINGVLSLIQTIQTFGVKRMAITYFQNEWVLAIANSKDPQTDSCLTNSAIYRWSSSQKIFQLLREVKTNDATDVTFLTAQDKSGNYKGASLSFVAFAQNGNSGDGEVVVLLFDETKKNYFMFESLRVKWSVTGVDNVCIQENCYLIVMVPQEGIHFYEYRYVEGFQRQLTVPIIGAQDISPFSWNYQLFFAVASSKTSLLAQGVVAGEPSPLKEYDEYPNLITKKAI